MSELQCSYYWPMQDGFESSRRCARKLLNWDFVFPEGKRGRGGWRKPQLKIRALSCKKEWGVQNVNVMLSIYLKDMLRKFVSECVSAQSPIPCSVLALPPGRTWRKHGSTIKLWLFEQNPFCLSSALIICSMDFCPSVSLSIAFLYDVPFYCKNCSTLYIYSY